MKYEGVGGIGYDMYSGERGKTTVLRHWGGLKKHEELEGDLRPLLRERERKKAGWKCGNVAKTAARDRECWSENVSALCTYWRGKT